MAGHGTLCLTNPTLVSGKLAMVDNSISCHKCIPMLLCPN